ncbi:restriction endonuclease subunit S [Bacteroides acidifaciens]|uniref:restriction endonuclease subunit S n=1 Tax=Bacteroides acidifaciens TaxID=85831 RepID=UPI0025AE65BA|nr:restriction endonuclease subunit S [Bacteroides acidifaciens]
MGGITMKQRYDSYKPSGIDWIGDIPSHWDITPLKRNLRMPLKYGANEPAESEDKNYPRYIRITDIDSNGNLKDETFKSLEPSKATDYLLAKGDVLFARSGATVGKTYIFKEPYEACFAGYLIKASCSLRLSPQFLFYYTNSGMYNNWKNSIFIQSTIQNIGADKYSLLPLPLPPIAEQEAIAAWLDEKCGEIDAAIAKVDREIELIDELKQSKISRVVTRGLNPDALLRPSGIDWIGDIPKHWTKCRLKFIGSARNGLTYSPSDVKDSGKLVIRSSNIQDAKLNYDDCVFVANYPETLSVNSGDTIICSRNGSIKLIGKSVFIEDDMDVTFGAFMMRFRPYEHPKYSHYLLSIAISRYKGLFATTTINQLTADSLGKMEAVMPPYMEQVQIADYLDKQCAEIDGLKEKLSMKRETLTELRQSIISEVVTGKRKVI